MINILLSQIWCWFDKPPPNTWQSLRIPFDKQSASYFDSPILITFNRFYPIHYLQNSHHFPSQSASWQYSNCRWRLHGWGSRFLSMNSIEKHTNESKYFILVFDIGSSFDEHFHSFLSPSQTGDDQWRSSILVDSLRKQKWRYRSFCLNAHTWIQELLDLLSVSLLRKWIDIHL